MINIAVKISKTVVAIAGFYLAYTLMRIRHLVVQRQKEQDAIWREAQTIEDSETQVPEDIESKRDYR